jgi:N,N'-diacetylchitobiose phosphorylase
VPERKSILHGIEQARSDDALWIVVSTCEYVKETGDGALIDEVLWRFANERYTHSSHG